MVRWGMSKNGRGGEKEGVCVCVALAGEKEKAEREKDEEGKEEGDVRKMRRERGVKDRI